MNYNAGAMQPGRNRLMRLLARTVLDFSYLPKVGGTETRILVSRIPVLDASDDAGSSMIVRVHNVRISTGGGAPGSIVIDLIDDAWTPEDANRTFLGTTAITGSAVALNSSTAAGTFSRTEITGNLGTMASLRVVATQDTTTDFLSLMAEISIDLILKAG